MLSLVSMMWAVEVHLFGHYTVVFVSYDSVRVDRGCLSRRAFLYHGKSTGHAKRVGIPPDTF